MKTCIPCTAQSPDDAKTCGACGEASWSPSDDAPVAPPPRATPPPSEARAADPAVETAPIAPAVEGADAAAPVESEGADDTATDMSPEQGELVLPGDAASTSDGKGGKPRKAPKGQKPSGPLAN